GCIAIALAKEVSECTVLALDISPAALMVAQENITRAGVGDRVRIVESDLFAQIPADARNLDLVVANLPYIRSDEIPSLMPEVRDFEPRIALDGGPDGLDLVRRLIDEARTCLVRGGAIA